MHRTQRNSSAIPSQASLCAKEAQDFAKCLDYSSTNIKNCQIYMDLLEDLSFIFLRKWIKDELWREAESDEFKGF